MVEFGKFNKLTIKRVRDYGAHLDGGGAGDIILPKRYVPVKAGPGDQVEVFVYVNKEKRLRATTQRPYATVGQFAKLRVKANTSSGSFLDWGLQKDLLVPKKEQQPGGMVEGGSYVVFVFLEAQTRRIAASARLEKFLNLQPPAYDNNAEVDLLICTHRGLGFKAIINNSHWGMIYKNEVFQDIQIGQSLKGYIKKIRDDGKIDLSLQPPGYQKVDDIALTILKALKEHGGRIGITDKSPPEKIYSRFGVSKKTFKKAIGALYKKKLIAMDGSGIKLVTQKRAAKGWSRSVK